MINLGTVPFINAKPIIYPLEKGLIEHDFRITYYDPSLLSERLALGDVDIGLIPVAELLQRRSYSVVPGISISSEGRVDSVALVLGKDISKVKRVAIDARSQSSTALLRVILEIFYGLSPEYISRKYDEEFFSGVDAGMVIGDTGLNLVFRDNGTGNILDLGELWTKETGLPFVYAVYAVNRGVNLGRNYKSLIDSSRFGTLYIKEISRSLSGSAGISTEFCINYLTKRIRYDLGEKEIRGLVKYSEYLEDLGYCAKLDSLDFYSQ